MDFRHRTVRVLANLLLCIVVERGHLVVDGLVEGAWQADLLGGDAHPARHDEALDLGVAKQAGLGGRGGGRRDQPLLGLARHPLDMREQCVQASAGRHRTRRRVAVEGLQRDDWLILQLCTLE